MMKMSRQGSWKPRCVILLSTQTAESAAAEPPVGLVTLSTAWCYTHTEVEWRLCAHTHEAPGLVISQQGASGGSSSAGQPMNQERKEWSPVHFCCLTIFYRNLGL